MKAKIFALAALVLGMVSCQKEINGIAVDKNGEAAVTISVALPEEGATRAGGSNSAVGAIGNIDLENDYDIRYILEVYDENGTLAKRPIPNYEDTSTSTSFALRLVPGRHYRFVVWADFVLQGSEVALHYNAERLTDVSLINGSESNYSPMDESRDAYTGVYDTEKDGDKVFDSSSNIAITLTRPFAKLRVVTTDMNEIYSGLVSATVNYTSPLYNTFDALNATAKGVDANVTKVVDFSTMTYANENGQGQMTLFADYLFGAEDDRVMFTLDVVDETGLDIPTVTFNTNIPVQRNYLTTVAGPILTDSNNITVTIEERFDGYHEVEYVKAATAQELAEAIEAAEEGTETVIEIADDIVFGNSASTTSTRTQADNGFISVPKGKTISINLNGKNIIGTENTAKNFGLIQNNGNLTISGEGTIQLTATVNSGWNRYSAVISNNPGAELTVNEGVVIKHFGGTDMAYGIDALTNGNIGAVKTTINGATVVSTYRAVRQFLNSDSTQNELVVKAGTVLEGANKSLFFHDPSKKANLGKLVVEQGAQLKGDVYLFVTAGSTEWPVEVSIAASALVDNNEVLSANVPAGYAVVEKAGNYVVEKGFEVNGNEVAISSATGLEWVAAEVNSGRNSFEGQNVVLTADIDLAGYNWTPIGNATNDFIGNFDGNGKVVKNLTITNPALDEDGYAYAGLFGVTEYNTIKNLTIENVNISTKGHIVAAAIAYPYYTIVENVVVKGNIQIVGGDYVAGVLGYTRRCVNAKNLVVEANANSSITGDSTIGGVLSDLQMNGGLKADYSNFKASGLTINGNQLVGGISGIISGQTLNGATVENVTICCSDARKGQIAGAVGEESFITEANVKNVTGAENLVGATYDSGKTGKVTINGAVYEYKADGTITMNGALVVADGVVIDAEGAYCISNKAGMFWFANEVNVNKNDFNGKTVKLAADIDLNNAAWTPIGQTGVKTFNGVFDGQNHTIYNLNVNSIAQTGANYSSGLFGWVETHSEGNGILKNVKIENAVVKGNHNCGALVGYITEEYAIVDNCHVSNAAIECHNANSDANGDKAGALIGNATVATKVNNCSAANSTVSAGRDAGQLIGVAKLDNVTNCSATNVSVSANGEGTGANINNEVVGRKL